MAKIGMYPGSFDPITKGHMNILDKALKIFDKVVIAVVKNSSKNTFLTLQERTELIEEIYKDNSNVLRTGSKAIVHFKFCYKKEYLETGKVFFFRDGNTKGYGTILEIFPNI